MGLVLVSNDPLDAIPVQALVDSIAVCEEFPHYHWLVTTYASECPSSTFVYEETYVDHSSIGFFLQVLSIR